MSGWIKLHRDINNHWIWSNSDYLKWWLDILLEVNHTTSKVVIKNKIYECNRGEKMYSLDTWASRWNTNKSKVRRFLEMLKNDGMICIENETQTTRITVCNYDSYQEEISKTETQVKRKRNANETHLTPIKELKNDKEVYNITSSEDNMSDDSIDWNALLVFFNKTTGNKSRVVSEKVKKQFRARLKEGYTKEDIMNAIINCHKDPFHKANPHYLTLEFISRADKLEKYYNYKPKVVRLPEDWFHRELTPEQRELLTPERLSLWKRNKSAVEMEGGRLKPIEL